MTDRPCDIRTGFLFPHCVTCGGNEYLDNFRCADWAERLSAANLVRNVADFVREIQAIFPEIEIQPKHVARRFAITQEESRKVLKSLDL
ncbi:hypothetical protein [Martelella mediterranea]|uniref:Uncharacterized protein n=1 Tax=Martelella mediterranea TaxID=293089 RepID=A0A4R3NI23_9HYPH|nr:hypothetical protein [Martelella mediterranea]TCT34613.1 hypothetical protein EDC90_10337 [Martelella mediterranea]